MCHRSPTGHLRDSGPTCYIGFSSCFGHGQVRACRGEKTDVKEITPSQRPSQRGAPLVRTTDFFQNDSHARALNVHIIWRNTSRKCTNSSKYESRSTENTSDKQGTSFSRSSCPTPIPPNLRVKAPATVATATTAATAAIMCPTRCSPRRRRASSTRTRPTATTCYTVNFRLVHTTTVL
jgi:hypothetical protein